MENPTYIALSRLRTIRSDMASVANNIANASTGGFRGERTLFQEHLAKVGGPASRQRVSFVNDVGLFRDTREGPLEITNNGLDVAIRGEGYFVVGHPAQDLYSRSGRLHIDSARQIVTAEGYPIMGANGAPITLQEGADYDSLRVQGDGTVTTNLGTAGRINLVRFADEQLMRKAGTGFYATDQEPLAAPQASVLQGAIEGSNVVPVLEVTRMMEMLRDYQSTQRLVDQEHERLRTMISRLARVQS